MTKYKVQRTLNYAHTHYGTYDTRTEAEAVAKSRSILGYPSEVIEVEDDA